MNVHQAVKQHLNELFLPSGTLTVQIQWLFPMERKLVKSSEGFEKLLNVAEGELVTHCLSFCLSVCYCFSVTPSLSRWFFVFFCLSACEVKVASMVTAHSVYATMSHFITSC